jgi:hypothetical protein
VRGWVAVEAGSFPGDYCLTPDPSITISNAVIIASLGGPSGGADVKDTVFWSGYCNYNPLKFRVNTSRNGILSFEIPFAVMIP